MAELLVETQWLRDVIKGKVEFRKCPDCMGRGYIWCEDGTIYPDQSKPDEELQELCGEFGWTDECDCCNGLGYIEIP